MTPTQTAKSFCKNTLVYLGLAVAVAAAIPLLAGLALVVRVLVPVILVAVMVAFLVIPRFRRWFTAEADNSANYHGIATPTEGLWVHPAHAWARMEDPRTACVGADALALVALGQVDLLQAPVAGARICQGQPLFTLVHGERRLEVKAPVSGTVGEINAEAVARPTLLGQSPYGAGWVVRLIDVDFAEQRTGLKHGSGLRHWWRGQVDGLLECLRARAGAPTMADGGAIVSDLSSVIDEAQWDQIARQLFGQGAP